MIAIGIFFLLALAVLLGAGAKQANAEDAFALTSGLPLVLLLGSLLGLARNGNSMAFLEASALSLVFSVLVTGFGTGLVIHHLKNKTPAGKPIFLTLLAACPALYGIARWILSRR